MAATPDSFRAQVVKLIARFDADRSHYQSKAYSDAQARMDLLTALFKALGWDVENQPDPPRKTVQGETGDSKPARVMWPCRQRSPEPCSLATGPLSSKIAAYSEGGEHFRLLPAPAPPSAGPGPESPPATAGDDPQALECARLFLLRRSFPQAGRWGRNRCPRHARPRAAAGPRLTTYAPASRPDRCAEGVDPAGAGPHELGPSSGCIPVLSSLAAVSLGDSCVLKISAWID